MEALQYFIGKTCTILTGPLNRDFKEEKPDEYRVQFYQYFLGRVLDVDSRGILIEQILTPERLRSYFYHHNIVGICEEKAIEANTPENKELLDQIQTQHEKVRQQFENAVQASPTKDGPIVIGEIGEDGQIINLDAMQQRAAQMEEKFGK
jgi:hypothetical protein